MIGITQPIVKHSIAVERADDVAQAVPDALHIARTGRPGPVLIDLPVDVAAGPARDADARAVPARLPPADGPNGRQVRVAAARRSPRPGGRCSTRAAASSTPTRRPSWRRSRGSPALPVTTTLMALGAFPASRPALARDARHARHARGQLGDGRGRPDRRRRRALRRPRDRRARRVRPAARRSCTSTSTRRRSARTSPAHIPIVGDARLALDALARELRRAGRRRGRLAELVGADPRLAGRAPAARAGGAGRLRRPRSRARRAGRPRCGDAIVTTDVGQHQMWAANRLRFEPPAALAHLAAGWARWASACRPRSAPRPPLRARRSSACPARARS